MVSTLVVGTNTYQLQASANTILGDNIATMSWATKPSSTKDAALITAFYLLETQRWQGEKTGGAGQTAQHPRIGLTNCNGDEIDENTTAPDILRAQALLAYELVTNPKLAGSANTGSNIKRLQAGSASIEYFERTDDDEFPTTRFPARVQELIACYIEGQNIGGVESFGTDGDSIFDPCDDYDRTEPF
jgi:hypothetical protein